MLRVADASDACSIVLARAYLWSNPGQQNPGRNQGWVYCYSERFYSLLNIKCMKARWGHDYWMKSNLKNFLTHWVLANVNILFIHIEEDGGNVRMGLRTVAPGFKWYNTATCTSFGRYIIAD